MAVIISREAKDFLSNLSNPYSRPDSTIDEGVEYDGYGEFYSRAYDEDLNFGFDNPWEDDYDEE